MSYWKQSTVFLITTSLKYAKFSLYVCILTLGLNTAFAKDIAEHWEDFSNTSIQKPGHGNSSVVIFRPKDSINGPAVNVFIDGEYQASLLPEAYTQAPVCGGIHHMTVAYTNILTRYREKKIIGKKINPQTDQISYYRIVSNSDKSMRLEEVSSEQALKSIKKLSIRQNHTIPRISQRNCDKPGQNVKSSGHPVSSVLSIPTKY